MSYVGPDDERVRDLVKRFRSSRRPKPLAPQAQAAIVQGCDALLAIAPELADGALWR